MLSVSVCAQNADASISCSHVTCRSNKPNVFLHHWYCLCVNVNTSTVLMYSFSNLTRFPPHEDFELKDRKRPKWELADMKMYCMSCSRSLSFPVVYTPTQVWDMINMHVFAYATYQLRQIAWDCRLSILACCNYIQYIMRHAVLTNTSMPTNLNTH